MQQTHAVAIPTLITALALALDLWRNGTIPMEQTAAPQRGTRCPYDNDMGLPLTTFRFLIC